MNRQLQKRLARSGKPLIQLHVLGAAGAVTGSMNLFEYTEKGIVTRFLLDVGLTVENASADFQNRLPRGLKASDINFIVISHAHLDHSGYLPKLVKDGFKGPVYVTEATKDLLEILLTDCAYLQEKEAERKNRRAERKATAEQMGSNGGTAAKNKKETRASQPLYTMEDARRALGHLKILPYDARRTLSDAVAVTFTEAGHILGAAVVNLEIGNGAEKRRFCFTGNVGRPNVPILKQAAPLPPADYLMTESTYGDRLHQKRDRLEVLAGIICSAYERAKPKNGAILVPAFAVGRAQTVLYDLRELMVQGRIPKMQVFVDGPMTIRATAIHRKHSELFNEKTAELVADGIDPFTTPRQKECMAREVSEAIDLPQNEPFIVVGSSGMANGGRIVRHLTKRLPYAENTVVFVGYQGTGTLGQQLVGCRIDPKMSCASQVKIGGKLIRIKATIEFMGDYSGHADYADLLNLMGNVERKPKTTFVVHGSEEALAGLKERLERFLHHTVVVPKHREVFTL